MTAVCIRRKLVRLIHCHIHIAAAAVKNKSRRPLVNGAALLCDKCGYHFDVLRPALDVQLADRAFFCHKVDELLVFRRGLLLSAAHVNVRGIENEHGGVGDIGNGLGEKLHSVGGYAFVTLPLLGLLLHIKVPHGNAELVRKHRECIADLGKPLHIKVTACKAMKIISLIALFHRLFHHCLTVFFNGIAVGAVKIVRTRKLAALYYPHKLLFIYRSHFLSSAT